MRIKIKISEAIKRKAKKIRINPKQNPDSNRRPRTLQMGIKDLLRFMKPYIEPVHIKKYAGKRVRINPIVLSFDFFRVILSGACTCSLTLQNLQVGI